MKRLALSVLVTAFLMASVIPVGALSQDGYVAIQFEWESSKPYAGQFHDFVQFTADEPVIEDKVDRVFGSNRYLTAAQLTASRWDTGTAEVVVLASGEDFPDALTASGLAGAYGAPVLITRTGSVPVSIMAEIGRLTDGVAEPEVIIVGGEAAVTAAVAAQLVGAGYDVSRLAGRTRFETSAMVAEEIEAVVGEGSVSNAFVVRGDNFADALALSPYAWAGAIPVLLVRTNAPIPPAIVSAMRNLDIKHTVLAGGTAAVSDAVQESIVSMGVSTERVFGQNRYATAAEFARWGVEEFGATNDFVGIASGANFPDALAGGPVVGAAGGVMALTAPMTLSPATAGLLQEINDELGQVVIFGGLVAVSQAVEDAIIAIVDFSATTTVAGMSEHVTGAWDRLPSSERIEEDRVSIMFENPAAPVQGFGAAGCYVTCHDTLNNMPNNTAASSHYAIAEESDASVGALALDMWHWRGGRSGPMGYAEDTWVAFRDYAAASGGRMRDSLFSSPATQPPTNWVRAGGDRLREDQVWGGGLTWMGTDLPRFVFNPDKSGFDNFFLADPSTGEAFTNPLDALHTVVDDQYRSQLVVYQDYDFHPRVDDKVNSIDVQWLLFRAGEITNPGYRGDWDGFWSDQLPSVLTPEDAESILDSIVAAIQDGVMVTRSIGFICESGQHDITSERTFEYDPENGIWTVTMFRSLDTGEDKDVSLAGIPGGTVYNLGFAMHDVQRGRLSHHVSFPYTFGGSTADIVATQVDDVWDVDWSTVGEFETRVFQPGIVSKQHLEGRLTGHGEDGATMYANRCQNCHNIGGFDDGTGTRLPVFDVYAQSQRYIPEGTDGGVLPVKVRAVFSVDSISD